MTKITDIKLVPVQGAYYYEDIAALQAKPTPENERWFTPGATPGFTRVREIAEAVSVGLVLDNGRMFWGDAIAVSYSGKAGRRGVYRSEAGIEEMNQLLRPALIGEDVSSFRKLAQKIETLALHNASRYGASQAVLLATAETAGVTMTQILCREWNLPLVVAAIPLQGSSGNDRYDNADKMIANRLSALPHTQVDDIPAQLGLQGEVLLDYVRWLKRRIETFGLPDYSPTLHLDVHGSIAHLFKGDTSQIAAYLLKLEAEAKPFALRMESVFLASTRQEQIDSLFRLKVRLAEAGSSIKLVADEWANDRADIAEFARSGAVHMIHIKMPDLGSLHQSLEAVLDCRKQGVETLLGGSCIETDLSTRASVHVALASRPNVFLTKPGMGVNEAILLCRNEMSRTLAVL